MNFGFDIEKLNGNENKNVFVDKNQIRFITGIMFHGYLWHSELNANDMNIEFSLRENISHYFIDKPDVVFSYNNVLLADNVNNGHLYKIFENVVFIEPYRLDKGKILNAFLSVNDGFVGLKVRCYYH